MGVSGFLSKIEALNEYQLNISSMDGNNEKSVKVLGVQKVCSNIQGQY